MRNWINLITESQNQIRLIDLYTPADLSDETEKLAHEVSQMEWDELLTVHEMSPEQAKQVLSNDPSKTVYELYQASASKRQKKIVAQKVSDFEEDRIIVLSHNEIIDGNHHLVAGIMANKTIKYVDLSELDTDLHESAGGFPKPYTVVVYDEDVDPQQANVYKNPNAGLLKKLIGPFDCRALLDKETNDLYVWAELDCYHDDVRRTLNIGRIVRLMLCNPDREFDWARVSIKGFNTEPIPADPEIAQILHQNRGLRNLFGEKFDVDVFDWN